MHLFALHLRRTVLGLRLKRIGREFVIKDDIFFERSAFFNLYMCIIVVPKLNVIDLFG